MPFTTRTPAPRSRPVTSSSTRLVLEPDVVGQAVLGVHLGPLPAGGQGGAQHLADDSVFEHGSLLRGLHRAPGRAGPGSPVIVEADRAPLRRCAATGSAAHPMAVRHDRLVRGALGQPCPPTARRPTGRPPSPRCCRPPAPRPAWLPCGPGRRRPWRRTRPPGSGGWRKASLGLAEQAVGRPQLVERRSRVRVGEHVGGQPVRRLVERGGEEPVAVVAVELAEVPVQVDVAHHRVASSPAQAKKDAPVGRSPRRWRCRSRRAGGTCRRGAPPRGSAWWSDRIRPRRSPARRTRRRTTESVAVVVVGEAEQAGGNALADGVDEDRQLVVDPAPSSFVRCSSKYLEEEVGERG